MIDSKGISDRIARLEDLAQALGQEVRQAEIGEMALAEHERQEYVTTILDAVAGLDAARAVLVRVRARLRGAS